MSETLVFYIMRHGKCFHKCNQSSYVKLKLLDTFVFWPEIHFVIVNICWGNLRKKRVF